MMKIGVIGLGNIAQKAYLPVLAGIENVEFHLYTRNQNKLSEVGDKYRFVHLHENLDSLLSSGIKGAMIHSATDSHQEIIEMLLNRRIHVFVDKPITDQYQSTKKLIELANKNNLILMAGFNRRYAPVYRDLKNINQPNMILIQKNRNSDPSEPRAFVFDDFIHVVDTLRYLFPNRIEDIQVTGKLVDQKLHHVVIQLISKDCTAIGIMNRDSGSSNERVEIMSSTEKRTVDNVSDSKIERGKDQLTIGGNDWEPTLRRRGFEQMIGDFLSAVKNDSIPMVTNQDALETHKLCEQIVIALEK